MTVTPLYILPAFPNIVRIDRIDEHEEMSTRITTYNPERFLTDYVLPESNLSDLLRSDFGKFFIVRVQDLLRTMKLPIPPTRATIHTLIYLTEGEAIMTIGSDTYRIEKDECLIVAAGQVFSFTNQDVNKGYQCSFHSDFIASRFGGGDFLKEFDFLRVWGNPRIRLDRQHSAFVHALMKRMVIEYSEHGLSTPGLLSSYLLALLCELNRAYQPSSDTLTTTGAILTNRFRELIVENVRTVHQVADYAAMLHVSPNHLNKAVKGATGKPAVQWISEAILLEAKVLLYQSNLSVGEIAAQIGFFDQSYFSRMFKKHEGVTPSEFRRMIEKS